MFDFEKSDLEKLPDLKSMDVGILINCVEIQPDNYGNFMEQPEELAFKLVKVNVGSYVRMLELVLPGMIERNTGIVVNISSLLGWRPIPYMSSYSGTKAAICFYSDTLYDEFHKTKIKIQCLIPWLVSSQESKVGSHSIFSTNPDNYAKSAVKIIGKTRISTGCFRHDMYFMLQKLFGFWLFKKIFITGIFGHIKRRGKFDGKTNQTML